MKRPARVSLQLPESLHQRLNSYALAASAAGVSLVALAHPSEARIIYTRTHHVIGPGESYMLDLNRDGKTDFIIRNNNLASSLYYSWRKLSARPEIRDNAISAIFNTSNLRTLAYAFDRGARIGPYFRYFGAKVILASLISDRHNHEGGLGYWLGVKDHYLGLACNIHGKTHYGWARLSVDLSLPLQLAATVTGYAYETIPNKPILTGKTTGSDALEGASLGALAAGSAAPSTVRKKAGTE